MPSKSVKDGFSIAPAAAPWAEDGQEAFWNQLRRPFRRPENVAGSTSFARFQKLPRTSKPGCSRAV